MNRPPHSVSDSEIADNAVFRDHVATVDEAGNRIWIYPKKPIGKFYNARTYVSWVLLAILFLGPFISINGRPLLLLNFLERKFIILGIVFWPQDLHLFGLALITFIVFIILFTAAFGRIFCGWACPQTIFMEMVFRKIEYLIDGDAREQRKLSKAPWTMKKIMKRVIKLSVFFTISVIISNVFLAYIIGKDALLDIIMAPPSEHLGGFIAMLIFSLLFFGVFAWFREQACTMVCPYGRFQSVLLDQNSIVVHYDFLRGEPRGKGKRKEGSAGLGDCIDCHACVDVCPTGIDIRNGTQLECVNCTACIDACEDIMTKVNRPTGLIKYASYNGIKSGTKKIWNARVLAYSGILVTLIGLLIFLLSTRVPVETTILRTPGVLYQMVGDDVVRNLYNVKLVNKTWEPKNIELRIVDPPEARIVMISALSIPPDHLGQSAFFIDMDRTQITRHNIPVQLDIIANSTVIETITTTFIAPE